MCNKDESIKQLRLQLEYLTIELNKITGHIQLLEINETGVIPDLEPEKEISELIRKQNTISHEIIAVKKRIHRLSAKTILKVELLILPIVIILLIFVTINYTMPITEPNTSIKSQYLVENLQGGFANQYNHWNAGRTPLIVNIENNANLDNQKIQYVKNAIMSTDIVTDDSSLVFSETKSKSSFFKGWYGALATISNTKYPIPQFDIVQAANGNGEIIVTLSTMKDIHGYSAFTRTLTDGNQIRKVFVTIYDADKLTNNQLESVVRQNFGHALGLPQTSNHDDLMYESFATNNSYISACDINSIKKLYNGEKLSDDFCS